MAQLKQKRPRQQIGWLWIAIPAMLALVAGYIWLRILTDKASDEAPKIAAQEVVPAATAAPEIAAVAPQSAAPDTPPAPAPLQATLAALGGGFDGDVGIVVRSIDSGWSAQHNGGLVLPQQSLSKLWVVAAMLDRVDAGELSLDDQITLTAADLSIFHQPIRKNIMAQGRYTTSIADLMHRAMTQSDNTANAALFEKVGGKEAVLRFLASKGLSGITLAESEKALQMAIVGMQWSDSFSYGKLFWQARERVPFAQRMQSMGAYLANPPDGATSNAFAEGLAKLASGKLLSPASTAFLIDLMTQSKTGPKRLRGGLAPGWSMPHKTGTGQVLKLLATAYNDVGILTSPAGKRYAVVVMIGSTNRPVPERQDLMQAVTRAVIACEGAGLC